MLPLCTHSGNHLDGEQFPSRSIRRGLRIVAYPSQFEISVTVNSLAFNAMLTQEHRAQR